MLHYRSRVPLGVLAALLIVLSAMVTPTMAAVHRHGIVRHVTLHPAIGGQTLSVAVSASARTSCGVSVGSGAAAVQVGSVSTNGAGHAVFRTSMSDLKLNGRQPVTAVCGHGRGRRTAVSHVFVPSQPAPAAVSTHKPLTTVLNVLLDVLLGGSLVLFIGALVQMIVVEDRKGERFLLSLALVAGAIVALGAQSAGVGFATYTVDSLTGVRPGGGFFKAVSLLVPGGLAAGFGWYFLRVMRRSAAKGLRFMSFLGMLTIVGFAEIFAQATSTKGVFLGAAAIPNASFVAGMILAVLVFAPDPDELPGRSEGRFAGLTRLFSRVSSRRVAFVPGVADGHQPPSETRAASPFDDD
jgi:hypothetical protein